MLYDSYSRKIEYLRLSITDLCNLRCNYCMPIEGAVKQSHKYILSYEEMTRLVSILVRLGIRSVRITGGEPLVRKNLSGFISMLRKIPKLENILLTTNGYRLKELAQELKYAGLNSINIHVDTLDPERYELITHGGSLKDVLAGIDAAQDAGLEPIKLNSVLLKDYNLHDIESMARFAAERGLMHRFIEMMPIGPAKDMKNQFVPSHLVLDKLSQNWTLLPYGKKVGLGPAEYYKIVELDSIVGFIHAVSKPFCHKCNRIRVTADGRIQDCLAYDDSNGLRALIRTRGMNDKTIMDRIRNCIGLKQEDHGDFVLPQYSKTCGMYGIGG